MSNDKLREGLKALDEISPFAAAVREIERLNKALGEATAQKQKLADGYNYQRKLNLTRAQELRTLSTRSQVMMRDLRMARAQNESLRRQRDSVLQAAAEKVDKAMSGRLSSQAPTNQSVPKPRHTDRFL